MIKLNKNFHIEFFQYPWDRYEFCHTNCSGLNAARMVSRSKGTGFYCYYCFLDSDKIPPKVLEKAKFILKSLR